MERSALAAWRTGRYGAALGSWSERGRLVATETPQEAAGAMVGTLLARRAGALDPHAELRGLVMLAATNEGVERLNDAAQAAREALDELGPGRDYELAGRRSVRLHEGEHCDAADQRPPRAAAPRLSRPVIGGTGSSR